MSSPTRPRRTAPPVYTAGNSWTETAVNWNTRPARTSGHDRRQGSDRANTWVEFDVTPFVTGNGTYSFSLAQTTSDGVDFRSRECDDRREPAATRGNPATRPCIYRAKREHASPSPCRRRSLIAGAIAFGVATSADPPESGPAVHSHSEHADIWTVNVQTRELTQQTLNADAREPAWSQEGEIAFSTAELRRVPVGDPHGHAGSTEIPVDTTVHHLFQPSWAPDGNRVAVVRLGHGIFVVDVASRTIKQLDLRGPSDEAPAWSPSGEWIAFDRLVRERNYELYAVHAGTGELRRLTHDPAAQTNPAWSPDGSRLAFAEQQSNGKWAIFTMGFDGNGRKRVTGSQISAQEPSWSPDGKKIAFILQELDRATRGGHERRRDGQRREADRPVAVPREPAWSPGRDEHCLLRDGRAVASSRRRY